MNPTPRPAADAVGSWLVSPSLLAVLIIGGVVLMVAAVYCLVVLLAVLLKSNTRRADARLALQQVGWTLVALAEKLVDLLRGRRRTDDDEPNDG